MRKRKWRRRKQGRRKQGRRKQRRRKQRKRRRKVHWCIVIYLLLEIYIASDIEVSFQVPFDGAVSTETFMSTISWIKFRSTITDFLSLAPSAVKVAYRFSTQPRSAQHAHLRNAGDLTDLFEKARVAQAKLLEKSKVPKDFFVELKNLETSANEKQKRKKKDTKKKKILSSFNGLRFNALIE
jgi:hypothetical protein